MTNAVIYCRISRDREGAGLGVERQEADCRALAERLGLTVDRVFVDNDVSAYSGKRRPAFEEMMALAEVGKVGVILAYSNSRLTRRMLELERLIGAHDRHGIRFHTVASGQDDLSTADGRMIAHIKASVDEAESQRISERTRRAKQEARDNGEWHGGWRPYGYEADGRTVREAEAAVIAEMCQGLLDGTSMIGLVRRLNDRGETTSTGKPWSVRTLQRVLKRPHPELDDDTTEAVRALLEDPSRRTTPGPARRWLLTGLAVCDVCKAPVRGSGSSKGAGLGTYPAYRCTSGKHVVINAVVLDEFITAVVIERLSRPDAAALLSSPAVDTSATRARVTVLRAQLNEMADNLDIDLQTLARRSKALRAELDTLEEQLASVARATPMGAFAGRDPAEVWAGLDLDRRRAVVARLMTITIRRTVRGVVPRDKRWRDNLPSFDPRRVHIVAKQG